MADGKPEEKTTHKLITNPNKPQVYTNGVSIAIGFYEIRMVLLETAPSGPNESTTREILSVILPPECARTLGENLKQAADQFEKEFGALRKMPTEGVAEV